MPLARRALASLALAPLLGCSNGGALARAFPVEALLDLPEVNAKELAAMEPDGSLVRLWARLDRLEYFIVDANPTEFSWRGLRLARDDDRLHGEVIWMVFGEGFTPRVRVDAEIGGVAELPNTDGVTTIDVPANPELFGERTGWIVLEGAWHEREGWHEPVLEVTRVWRGAPVRCGMIPGGHPTMR